LKEDDEKEEINTRKIALATRARQETVMNQDATANNHQKKTDEGSLGDGTALKHNFRKGE